MNPVLFLPFFIFQVFAQNVPSCDSKVFCQGNLLHTVQMAQIFNDSKTFVDLKLKNNEETTLANFDIFMNATNNNPSKDEITKFVDDNFEDFYAFDDWTPEDYSENPEILSKIQDPDVKSFAQNLVKIWPSLAKILKQEVFDNPELFTFLPVDNGFVIPGGRFKEFYYWDSYWIIKGLLLCDMTKTAKGMLNNFLEIVEKNGFMPNGARKYYLNRSQPPLLTSMAYNYLLYTKDTEWLNNSITTLEQELIFWLNNRLTEIEQDGVNYTVAHYDSESGSPRPESYYEDYTNALSLNSEEKIQLWAELKTGAETGWDFTCRWFVDNNGGNSGNLSSLKTRRIIPVDLNSYLCQAFNLLSQMYNILGNQDKADFWNSKYREWQNTIEKVFYNSDDGIWYDVDSELKQHRKFFFPSNFAPLWTEVFEDTDEIGEKAAEYFIKQNLTEYQGGIPASLEQTGEQWDFPNAWPPLQSIVVMGLERSGNAKATELAKDLAQKWITANMIGYNETGEMFEKYDAVHPGKYGGGGEYVVQSGFGWTNGVAFEFIDQFYIY